MLGSRLLSLSCIEGLAVGVYIYALPLHLLGRFEPAEAISLLGLAAAIWGVSRLLIAPVLFSKLAGSRSDYVYKLGILLLAAEICVVSVSTDLWGLYIGRAVGGAGGFTQAILSADANHGGKHRLSKGMVDISLGTTLGFLVAGAFTALWQGLYYTPTPLVIPLAIALFCFLYAGTHCWSPIGVRRPLSMAELLRVLASLKIRPLWVLLCVQAIWSSQATVLLIGVWSISTARATLIMALSGLVSTIVLLLSKVSISVRRPFVISAVMGAVAVLGFFISPALPSWLGPYMMVLSVCMLSAVPPVLTARLLGSTFGNIGAVSLAVISPSASFLGGILIWILTSFTAAVFVPWVVSVACGVLLIICSLILYLDVRSGGSSE